MTDFQQTYINKLNNYLNNPPIINMNVKTYLDENSLKYAIINNESLLTANSDNLSQHISATSALLANCNQSNINTIIEIDALLRSPEHLRLLPSFSNVKINFNALAQDLIKYNDNPLKLMQIVRILSRDDFVCKVLYMNYKFNNLVSLCLNTNDNKDLDREKLNTRMLINTRTYEAINQCFTMNDLVFKYLEKNNVLEFLDTNYTLTDYFESTTQIVEENFKKSLNQGDYINSLDCLRQSTAYIHSNLFDTLTSIDKKFKEITPEQK